MTSPIVLAFCAPGPIFKRVVSDCDAAGITIARPPAGRPLREFLPDDSRAILLGVGAGGCAALAKRVADDGIDGVQAVVLIDPQAPWAQRCRRCGTDGLAKIDVDLCGNAIEAPCPWCKGVRLPLRDLEPLRAVTKGALQGEPAGTFSHTIHYAEIDGPVIETSVKADRTYPLRFIIACHPEPAACGACKGSGEYLASAHPESTWCRQCSGTGRALGSAEVAAELLGTPCDTRWEMARRGERCDRCGGEGKIAQYGDMRRSRCATCNGTGRAIGCVACGGSGTKRDQYEKASGGIGACSRACSTCSGTGRTLGSGDVARELTGRDAERASRERFNFVDGAMHLMSYPTRAALEEHAIGEALRIAMG